MPSTGLSITFPTAFSSTPVITCTPKTLLRVFCIVDKNNVSPTGFKAVVYIDSGSGDAYPAGGVEIGWAAELP